MQIKRIGVIVSDFPKTSETFIVSKFLGLLKKDWDVHVFCNRSDAGERKKFPALNAGAGIRKKIHAAWPSRPKLFAALLLPIIFLRAFILQPRRAWRYLSKGFRQFGFDTFRRFYLDSALILAAPDLIHFEFGSLAVGRTYVKELLNCKMTVSFRGYDLNFSGIEDPHYYSEVWKTADGIHCLGQDLWARAQKRGCPSNKNHALISPAIDAGFFTPQRHRSFSDQPIHILSVGRLEWKKGYEFALEAVRILKGQGLRLDYRIVGDGNYLESVAFCRHQLGLEDCVSFLGAQSQEEIRDQMQWADLFLHAAVSEGFCNAVLEAQSMELPVVCTDADGLSENVVDGETGFVVPRRDPQALAQKLSVFAKDPDLRKRMGQSGRQRVLAHFQLSDQIRAFEDFYGKALNA